VAEPSVHGSLIGTTVAHFRVVGEIGAGGMGAVYRAVDVTLRRTVALKVLPPAFVSDTERRARFLREARAAAAITHRNIASVHEVGEADGRVFIAMELVDGRSLRARLADGALPIEEAVRIAREIASALAAAHERGVVHRDIKPDNVMLTPEGDVKVLDFGLAVHERSISAQEEQETESLVTHEGSVLGTPAYMSPEQARGHAVDHRSDLFSLGVVLYEMLAGMRPFVSDAPMDVMIAISRDEAPRPSTKNAAVSPELEAIVVKCMEKKADARYATARDVVAALGAIGASSGSASSTSPSRAPATPWKRTRARVAAFALVLVSVVAIVVAVRLRARDTPAPTSASAVMAPSSSAWIDPPPVSSNAEAVLLYNDGLRRYHDKSGGGNLRMTKAAELDPDFAAALYMLVVGRGAAFVVDGRPVSAKAFPLREKLPPRDRAILEAVEPIFRRDPADFVAAAARIDDVAARFPNDPFVLVQQGELHGTTDRGDAIAILERALSLAPREAWTRYALAAARVAAGDTDGALRDLRACLDTSPVAAMCLEMRMRINVGNRACAAVESDARQWAVLRPDIQAPNLVLTQALIALGRPIGAARESARIAEPLVIEGTPSARVPSRIERAALESAGGDFLAAESRLVALAKEIETSRSEWEHAIVAAELALTYSEMGDERRAANVAAEFVRKHDAWEPPPYGATMAPLSDLTGWHLRIATHGAISEVEAERLRAMRIAWWRTRAQNSDGGALWFALHVNGISTPAEARAAFAARDAFVDGGTLAPPLRDDESLGLATFLVGRIDEAIPMLERAAGTCRPLDAIVPFTRARFHLGRAREAKGDTAGACAEYARVLDRWGSAKPKSVTADAARARMRALGCK
jgi:serine/threonine-protein kinase